MPFSLRATYDTDTIPVTPDRYSDLPIASEASARAAGGTLCWGKEDPMQRYAGQNTISAVERTVTSPVGATIMLTVGEPTTCAKPERVA